MAILSVAGLAKRYKEVQALGGVDLEVRAGEVFGFLGPNGAGKTTFTKCVTGFVRPDAGRVEVAGIDALAHPTRSAAHVGLVPDQYDFYPNLTGRQHLDFYGRIMGMNRLDRLEAIDKVLTTVRMHERADSKTKGYSHGMKQRICIGQAIMHGPDIVFFDEPTNGLDPKGAYELRALMRDIARRGSTVFLNSHQLNEVQETCQRVAIMDRGRVLALENVDTLRSRFGAEVGATIRVHNPSPSLRKALEKVVGKVAMEGDNRFRVPGDDETVGRAVEALARAGGLVVEVTPAGASLESVFLKLTEEAA